MYIIKNTTTALNIGMMAAHLETLSGKISNEIYDHCVTRLAAMKNTGQIECFPLGGKIITVIKVS